MYQPAGTGYSTIGVTQKVTVWCDGMNEKGLATEYTFIRRKRLKDGFICNLIGRLILETCANIEGDVSFLKNIPHYGLFSYVLKDTNQTKAAFVEASRKNIEVRSGAAYTNHYQIMKKENHHYIKESKRRLEVMEKPIMFLQRGRQLCIY